MIAKRDSTKAHNWPNKRLCLLRSNWNKHDKTENGHKFLWVLLVTKYQTINFIILTVTRRAIIPHVIDKLQNKTDENAKTWCSICAPRRKTLNNRNQLDYTSLRSSSEWVILNLSKPMGFNTRPCKNWFAKFEKQNPPQVHYHQNYKSAFESLPRHAAQKWHHQLPLPDVDHTGAQHQ